MNTLTIPPSPNWYDTQVMASVGDNVLVYGSNSTLVILQPADEDKPALIKLIPYAHTEKICSVSLNSGWSNIKKFAVTTGSDKLVKLWNLQTYEMSKCIKTHVVSDSKMVGATFAGDDRVISVQENGLIVIWNLTTDVTTPIKHFLGIKSHVTCLSSCPHASWLVAFGLKKGRVIIADMRKTGTVIHKLKESDRDIVSLSWCPTPQNIITNCQIDEVKVIRKIHDKLPEEGAKDTVIQNSNEMKHTEDVTKHNADILKPTEVVINESTGENLEIENDTKKKAQKNDEVEAADMINLKFIELEEYTSLAEEDTCENDDKVDASKCDENECKVDASKCDENECKVDASKCDENECKVDASKCDENECKVDASKCDENECKVDASKCDENECKVDASKCDENECKSDLVQIKDAKIEMKDLWTNLKFPDDEDITPEVEPLVKIPPSDFLTECEALKTIICTFKNDDDKIQNPETPHKSTGAIRKVLIASRNKAKDDDDVPPMNIVNDLFDEPSSVNKKESDETLEDDLDKNSKNDEEEHLEATPEVTKKDSDEVTEKLDKIVIEDVDLNEILEKNKELSEVNPKLSDEITEKLDKINIMADDLKENLQTSKERLEALQELLINKEDKVCANLKTMEALKTVCLSVMKNEDEPIKLKQRPEFLLACSTRDGSIYIWKALTEGRLQVKLSLGSKYRSKKDAWIPLLWIRPKILLSAGNDGQLLRWDLNSQGKFTSKIVHQDHKNRIFSITAPLRISGKNSNNEMELPEDNLGVWTVGPDRMILFTLLNTRREVIYCYPTNGAYNCVIETSLVDPNKLAIGTEDGMIKFWDLSRKHCQYIFMANSKLKYATKVSSIAWHPNKECILAFGTSEGKVGKLNSGVLSKGQDYYYHYFKTNIHQIEWGPKPNESETFGIYVCSGGKVGFYKEDVFCGEPSLISVSDNEFITHLRWKPDYTLFACGTKNGNIIILDPNMNHLYSLYFQKHAIMEMSWHPLATASDTEVSPCHYWLAATTSMDFKVVVYNLENYTSERTVDETIVAQFDGTLKQVNSMAWSQHQSGLLVCASEDGIAQVYNVITKEVISTFVNNNCESILACIWSPLDNNFIISTGRDFTIRIWNIMEHQKLSIEEIVQLRAKRLKTMSNKNRTKKDEIEQDDSKDKIPKNYLSSITSAGLEHCKKLLSLKECGQGDHQSEDRSNKILQFFGCQEDMHQLMEHQIHEHNTKGKYALHDHVSLWKGNISESIREAIKENRVTPWLISMAPAVSPKLWLEACEVYAKFLEESNPADPIAGASYYLACHKIEEAIKILCDHNLFKEAIAIAKCRLPSDDPNIDIIMNKWATATLINGAFELAALCFIALGKYKDAAQVLFKRTDLKTLEFAAELAQKAGDSEMHKAIMFRYNSFKESNNAPEIISTEDGIPELKTLKELAMNNMTENELTVLAAEEISNSNNSMPSTSTNSDVIKEINNDPTNLANEKVGGYSSDISVD